MKYAIVESGGKQFRAVEGGTLEVDRLPIEPGVNVKLEQVLLLADGENITVGKPLIKDMPIWTTVMEHFKGPKVTIFNYSPKKRIRVKIGHRQNYTRLLVEQIGGSELVKKEPVKVEKTVEVKAEKAKKPVKAELKTETASPKVTSSPKVKKPAAKVPAKAPAKAKTKPAKPEPKPSSKKTTPVKAEPKASPKGKAAPKKPAAK